MDASTVAAPIVRVPAAASATSTTDTGPSPGPITGLLVAVTSTDGVGVPPTADAPASVVCTRSFASVAVPSASHAALKVSGPRVASVTAGLPSVRVRVGTSTRPFTAPALVGRSRAAPRRGSTR